MWLNIFKTKGRHSLSPIELLALLSTPSEVHVPAREIISVMEERSRYWTPEPGTVYPVLHRLVSKGLLERSAEKKTAFRLTDDGVDILISNAFPMLKQIEENLSFFLFFSEKMIDLDCFEAEELVDGMQRIFTETSAQIVGMKQVISDKKIEDQWTEVTVDFDKGDDNEKTT